ncbi:MAG: hypothetical protein R6U32_07705 [Candidatus Woesearchaeota archaeon]
MQSIVERARKAVKENREFFEALEDFDRTGKLRKGRYKERYNFTIDSELMRMFRSYCSKHNIKMSGVIEDLIREYIKKQQSAGKCSSAKG